MRGRPPVVTAEAMRKLRQWRAKPRGRRGRTLEGMAAVLGISLMTARRAAYGMGYYGRFA